MSGFLANFHFLRPWALLALAAVPLLWLLLQRGGSDAGGWRQAVDAHLLPYLIERGDGGRSRLPRVLTVLGWLIACIALAGPAWEREPMPLLRNEAARVFALELAPTMLAQDIKPSRLERARFKLDDMLARSRDYQTALIGYAGAAFVAAPLTDDVATVRHLVEALDPSTMPVEGNATGQAIERAAALITQAGQHQGQIVLLADSAGPEALAAARRARREGFTVSVLGVGTDAGAPIALAQGGFLKDGAGNVVLARIDEPALRELASAGGGHYAPLTTDRSDVDALLPDRAQVAAASTAGGGTATGDRWRDRGPWLLLVLLPLAALGFRRGWLMVLVFALWLPAPSVRAAGFADLWQRRDQQTAQALAQGDARQAMQLAPDAAWRGGAAYRDGDYARAAEDYAEVDSADGAYNRGNALAQAGRYEDALAAYDAALEREPGMADAIENRRLVEEALERQQQQRQQDQQKQGQQQDQPQGEPQQGQQAGQQQGQQEQQGQDGQQSSSPPGKQSDAASGGQDGQAPPQDQQQSGAQPDGAQPGQSQQGDTGGQQGASAQQGADERQREALSKAVDQALAKSGEPEGKEQGQATVAHEDAAAREQRQALEQWLERVPDDPGGLLRRKFMLEYQRRQQGKGDHP